MDERIDGMVAQLDELEAEDRPNQALDPSVVQDALAKMETQWGKELGKLKQELHQAIFAHNHNADLMKHQKQALDGIRAELDAPKTNRNDAERLKLAKGMLAKAESVLKGQPKQRKLEPLF